MIMKKDLVKAIYYESEKIVPNKAKIGHVRNQTDCQSVGKFKFILINI
jgi:hypothetical protein